MKRYAPWHKFILLALLALSISSCFGGGGSSAPSGFKPISTGNGNGNGGPSVNANQNLFKGKIYFTVNHILYAIDGSGKPPQRLTEPSADVRDPAVSPDGKWVAFDIRHKNYSDLAFIPAAGGTLHIVLSGNGHFFPVAGGFIHSDFYWLAQPQWSADSQSLLFLSDLQKNFFWSNLGGDFQSAPFLDMQVFEVPLQNTPTPQQMSNSNSNVIAYADYGDGGDRDPGFRPNHPNQIIYTHYTYGKDGSTQVIQIFLEDATTIAKNPGKYYPGIAGGGLDPGVALTSPKVQNIEPTFSPDGNSIAYIRRETNGQMSLYVMPVAEGVTDNPNDPKVQQQALVPYNKSSLILTGQFISQPIWSPDGKQIAYITYNNNTYDMWLANVVIDAKTKSYKMQGSPIQLTTGGIDGDSRPFWTA